MAGRPPVIFAGVGALAAELVAWAILLPWAHYRYTTGVVAGLGLWKPILMVAVIGGSVGLAAYAVRRLLHDR